ncbi:uncharacterized protein LOC111108212 [Crassostrea virginica]
MDDAQDIIQALDLNDLQELSRDEKAEMWQILASVGQSKLFQESLNANNTGKSNVTLQIEEVKKDILDAQSQLLRSSGITCKNPDDIMQECRQGSNNTFELLLKNIKVLALNSAPQHLEMGTVFLKLSVIN